MNRLITAWACCMCMICCIGSPALAQEADAPAAEEPRPAEAGSRAFDGFYLGMGGATTVLSVRTESRRTLGAADHDYSVVGGYGHQFRSLYVGAELHGRFGVGELSATGAESTIRRKGQGTWGADGLLGFVVSPAMMVHGRGGYALTRLEADAVGAAEQGGIRENVDGYRYGFGTDAILAHALTLRTEWTRTHLDALPGELSLPRLRPKTDQFQLSLLWRFGAPEPAAPAADVRFRPGLYLGVGGGRLAGSYVSGTQGELSFDGLNGQAYVGYGLPAGEKYYVAVEAGYGQTFQDQDRHAVAGGNGSTELDLKHEFHGSFIVGRLFRPDVLAYARFGYARGNFHHLRPEPDGGAGRNLAGRIFGIGTEAALPGRLFVRTEWQFLDYDTLRIAGSTPDSAVTLRNQDHYRVLLGMGIRL